MIIIKEINQKGQKQLNQSKMDQKNKIHKKTEYDQKRLPKKSNLKKLNMTENDDQNLQKRAKNNRIQNHHT